MTFKEKTLRIAESDRFLDLPSCSKALLLSFYLHADENGFVYNPNRLIMLLRINKDSVDLLYEHHFIKNVRSMEPEEVEKYGVNYIDIRMMFPYAIKIVDIEAIYGIR